MPNEKIVKVQLLFTSSTYGQYGQVVQITNAEKKRFGKMVSAKVNKEIIPEGMDDLDEETFPAESESNTPVVENTQENSDPLPDALVSPEGALRISVAGGKVIAKNIANTTAVELLGSEELEETVAIGKKEVSSNLIIPAAFEASEKTPEEWNALEDEERMEFIKAEIEKLAEEEQEGEKKTGGFLGGILGK